MATFQRFRFLATQCATSAARSPTASPSASPKPPTSPSFHLRTHRRRTLRRLLSRSSSRRAEIPSPADREEKGPLLSHTSLKDLFVASPESTARGDAERVGEWEIRPPAAIGGRRRWGSSGGRLRYRVLRRPWRPVLVSIPE